MSDYAPLLVDWNNDVNPNTLTKDQQSAYNAMREHNRLASDARARFEALIQADVAPGTHVVFNYRFGKLAMALADGDKEAKQAKPKANGVSLAAFLAKAKDAGRNA